MPDGSCASESNVAYVQAGSSGAACSKLQPCGTLAAGITANKAIVKLAAGLIKDNNVTVIDGKAVVILAAAGATLDRDADGPILVVRSAAADVSIYDLEITGGTGPADPAVQVQPNGGNPRLALTRVSVLGNQGGGVSSSGGSLAVSQSTISSNTGGGIFVMNGTFAIVGNVFFVNGTSTGNIGAISISTTQSSVNRLDFNSFNQNQTQPGAGAAIQCLAGTFTARNNIMSDNGTLTNMQQVGGTCGHAYSISRPGTLPPGTGNSSSDPMFVNTTTGDLHIQAASPARGAADPASDLTGLAARDIDGDTRGTPADIGADDVP